MLRPEPLLVAWVRVVDRLPAPPPPPKRGRGRPKAYPDRLVRKALVSMIVRRLHTVHELLAVLAQPTAELGTRRGLSTLPDGRYPTRRTWERRLAALPDALPARIACAGRQLVALLQPWAACGRAAAVDSTVLRARGGGGHQQERAAGVVPPSSIDTEAHWTESGWHGWVYGWQRHPVTTVAARWLPLAAELTAANAADNEVAPRLLGELPGEVRFVLGDRQDAAPQGREVGERGGRLLSTTKPGRYPHPDDGVAVRRVVHTPRSTASETFNGQCKGRCAVQGAVPTRGLPTTRRFALGAAFVYQLTRWHRHEQGLDLRVGLAPCRKAA